MSQIIADTLKLIADNQDVILSAVRLAATNKKMIMREIKFRAKRLDNGEWVNGFVLFNHNKSEAVIAKLTDTESVCENVIPDTVGQFTGLHDKNGTEIYEGDILRSDSYPFSANEVKDNYYAVVDWSYDSASFCRTTIKNPRSSVRGVSAGNCELMDAEEMETFEVIGNIHDNPELLKTE